MKPYELDSFELVPLPNMAMLDTNVLVAAFIQSDGQHETAKAFLELWAENGIALIPIPVLIEAWGMIVGSRKNRGAGLAMIKWALDPLVAQLIPGHHSHAYEVNAIANQFQVDVVDAWILWLVDDIHNRCELGHRVRIATFDASDFLRCAAQFRLRLYDIDAAEDIDYF